MVFEIFEQRGIQSPVVGKEAPEPQKSKNTIIISIYESLAWHPRYEDYEDYEDYEVTKD